MMAVSLAFVFETIEFSLTFFTALEHLPLLTAFDDSRTFSTFASHQSPLMLTRFAPALMTELRTRMRTIRPSFSSTNLPTRMWLDISLIFRVLELSTITVVFRQSVIELKLALWTAPCENDLIFLFVSVDVENPSFDAFQMHGDVTA